MNKLDILATKFQSSRARPIQLEVDATRIFARLSPFPRAGLSGVFEADSVRLGTEEGVPTHRVVYPRLPSGHPFKLFRVMEGWVEDVEVVWKQVAKSQPLR